MTATPQQQRGITLVTAMIFLLVFAALAAFTFRSSLSSVQTIRNMQWRSESINAANDAINQILSSPDFATNPETFTNGFNEASVDVTGDGIGDVKVTLPAVMLNPGDTVARAGPRCIRAEPIPNRDLDVAKEADVACMGSSTAANSGLGVATSTGTSTTSQGPSLCANTEWTLTVEAQDAVTQTRVRVTQGVGIRVPTTTVESCS